MTQQTEAQMLADALEADQQGIDLGAEGMGWGPSATTRTRAAAELRRLDAVNTQLLEVLEKIARVNAVDYEYQAWASAAIEAAHGITKKKPDAA